jgi:hypothetical protein
VVSSNYFGYNLVNKDGPAQILVQSAISSCFLCLQKRLNTHYATLHTIMGIVVDPIVVCVFFYELVAIKSSRYHEFGFKLCINAVSRSILKMNFKKSDVRLKVEVLTFGTGSSNRINWLRLVVRSEYGARQCC